MIEAIVALGLWLGSILGGSGPPGTVDVWLATYGSPGTIEDGGNFGQGISYYRLASFQKGTDYYRLCDLSGRKRSLVSRVEYQQPGTPPFSVYVPATLEVPPWGCGNFEVGIQTGKLGAWSAWDVFVTWQDYGKVRVSEAWAGPAE